MELNGININITTNTFTKNKTKISKLLLGDCEGRVQQQHKKDKIFALHRECNTRFGYRKKSH